MTQFALFLMTEHEARGGADDLVHIGTLDECVQKAEASSTDKYAHVAELPSLRIVRRGDWHAQCLSATTGLTKDNGTYMHHFKWTDAPS